MEINFFLSHAVNGELNRMFHILNGLIPNLMYC